MDERRPVTILFTDIVASTTLAEKIDPEEWKEIVNGAHQRVSAVVTRYEGTVAQFLGDGVLAFFGAPRAHDDDPTRAVRAALEILREISEYGRSLRGLLEDFQMRVGIHTGLVVVGAVGSPHHQEYLAMGDAVNLAARLQGAAQPGHVLLSEVTARLVRHAFELRDLGEINVKGKTERVHVFDVFDTRGVFSSGRGIEGFTSQLIGRDREFAQIRTALEELDAGHGQIVFVLGEAGIGKSRLVDEAKYQTSNTSLRKFIEGRAVSYGQALPFWTITQLLQNDLRLADGEHKVRIQIALRRRVIELFGTMADEAFPYLARLMGVELEGDAAQRIQALDGETLKRQTLLAIGEYFARTAERQPTILLLEDLHWADPSTLETLEQLFALTNRASLMLLALARVERDHGSWRLMQAARTNYEHRYTEINLKSLSNDEQNQLVANLLKTADISESTRRLILGRAEGNPLYLEEIIRNLIEQRAMVYENNRWHTTTEIAALEIPETLQGVLLARMDRLQDGVRRTLQLASVIGRSFLYRLLQAIDDAELDLDSHLAQLQRADLVREKARRPELEYIFKHSLIQEAAYESLLLERRREFHHKVGAALEQLFTDRTDEYLGLLAYHFDRAGKRDKAIDYFIRAGDKTRLEDALAESITFYRRALQLMHGGGEIERESETWLKLGMVYHTNFDFAAAYQANENAFVRQQESKVATSHTQAANNGRKIVRYSPLIPLSTLDPGLMTGAEFPIGHELFAGIAQIDAGLNLIPHAARSWEVSNDGRRYLVHLRNDVHWTDGNTVTAADYEWAWKRNLLPGTRASYAHFLDNVIGARAFRHGETADPDTVGVRALDAFTFEIRLETPTAYFPYIFATPVAFPLPRREIEEFGDEWWKPRHIVSNGAFRLVEFNQRGGAFERYAEYFGEFPGNVDRFEWRFIPEENDRASAYLNDELDWAPFDSTHLPANLAVHLTPSERHTFVLPTVFYLALLPKHPPLDDARVRRALIQAINKEKVTAQFHNAVRAANGGIIPPGMAGHSPDIGLPFDVGTARRLLAEAGFPDGRVFPSLELSYPFATIEPGAQEIVRQWQEHLGITIHAGQVEEWWPTRKIPEILCGPWVPDYPDPDGVLRTLPLHVLLQRGGWHNTRFGELLAEAGCTVNRAQRMAMYREADRLWVSDEVVVGALSYDWAPVDIIKPWVKNPLLSRAGDLLINSIRIEPE